MAVTPRTPEIRRQMPAARLVVLKRPLAEVRASLAKIRWITDEMVAEVEARAAMLDAVAAEPGVPAITFDDLRTPECCAWLTQHCLGLPFDYARWLALRDENIQIDLERRWEKLIANRAGIEALKAEALAEDTKPYVSVGQVPWDAIWPEADELGREHFEEVDGGVEPNRPYEVDADLARQLHDLGFMRV